MTTAFNWRLLAALLITIAMPLMARGQSVTSTEGTRYKLSAGLQMRAAAGFSSDSEQSRVGFGIRRARVRLDARFSHNLGFFVQVDGSGGGVNVLDFYALYEPSDKLGFRAGRLVGPQPRSFILTSMFQIDALDRAAIAERWGPRTIGNDGRDFGVEMRYGTPSADASIFLHNGDGSWERAASNFAPSLSSTSVTGMERTSLALSGAANFRPATPTGVEIGGFAGYNPAKSPRTQQGGIARRYATYGAHAYYGTTPGSQTIRAKADLIGITYEGVNGGSGQRSMGISILLAARPALGSEVYVRGEALENDTNGPDDADGFFSAGVHFSPSARRGLSFHKEKITLEYGRSKPGTRGAEPQNLISLQLQLAL